MICLFVRTPDSQETTDLIQYFMQTARERYIREVNNESVMAGKQAKKH